MNNNNYCVFISSFISIFTLVLPGIWKFLAGSFINNILGGKHFFLCLSSILVFSASQNWSVRADDSPSCSCAFHCWSLKSENLEHVQKAEKWGRVMSPIPMRKPLVMGPQGEGYLNLQALEHDLVAPLKWPIPLGSTLKSQATETDVKTQPTGDSLYKWTISLLSTMTFSRLQN